MLLFLFFSYSNPNSNPDCHSPCWAPPTAVGSFVLFSTWTWNLKPNSTLEWPLGLVPSHGPGYLKGEFCSSQFLSLFKSLSLSLCLPSGKACQFFPIWNFLRGEKRVKIKLRVRTMLQTDLTVQILWTCPQPHALHNWLEISNLCRDLWRHQMSLGTLTWYPKPNSR